MRYTIPLIIGLSSPLAACDDNSSAPLYSGVECKQELYHIASTSDVGDMWWGRAYLNFDKMSAAGQADVCRKLNNFESAGVAIKNAATSIKCHLAPLKCQESADE
jgi:hypothetical protein